MFITWVLKKVRRLRRFDLAGSEQGHRDVVLEMIQSEEARTSSVRFQQIMSLLMLVVYCQRITSLLQLSRSCNDDQWLLYSNTAAAGAILGVSVAPAAWRVCCCLMAVWFPGGAVYGG